MITAALGLQASNTQMQIATAVTKSSLDSQRAVVDALLGTGQQASSSLANVASGVGGTIDITA